MFELKSKKGEGFTALELLISATILIIIMSFVLANFRTSQYSSELDVMLKQVTDSISTVRTMVLGGQMIADPDAPTTKVYPPGGFGVHFNLSSPNQLVMFADFNEDGIYTAESEDAILNNGLVLFDNVAVVELCGLDQPAVVNPPCNSASWSDQVTFGNTLDIAFPAPGQTDFNYSAENAVYQFVGGVLEHQVTGRQAYFYISEVSGLVTGDWLGN